ncbi:zonular occludens toxin domain-containing protein [Pseudomonas sp. RL_15y_Pfl2_60]|uniref:zonular occludens toxin domain-containing protein n=1 Tax=Pseudomonas sp. RL_15y_Pfl2_60 TaxID=3088709 RepID=UPI0030DD39DF
MLYIRTGKPGHGKTLNTIREIDQKALAEGRVVYYHNINGLKPELLQAQWYEFEDPEKWFELPQDAIVVVDEAQGWFGSRDPRQRPPEFITRFETMRHQGHEVHLVTQDPRYLDVHLRRLCNGHVHYWRVFKSQQLIRFESEVVIEKVEVKSSFKDADKKTVRLDKKYFSTYTSTNAKHHFQAKLPTKFILAILVIIVAGVLTYRFYERYQQGKDGGAQSTQGAASNDSVVDKVTASVGSFIGSSPGNADTPRKESPQHYAQRRIPRIEGIPSSAPIYDELTQPVSYPRLYCLSSTDPDTYARSFSKMPSAVVNGKPTVCQCYTQQGTRVSTEFSLCKQIVDNGYFDPSIPDRDNQQQVLQAQDRPNPNRAPGFDQGKPSTNITVVGSEKGRFLW